tara:strand:- start:3658 stop:4911 length:1254 start_codon:yes stop_codon:yes gene_type:complete
MKLFNHKSFFLKKIKPYLFFFASVFIVFTITSCQGKKEEKEVSQEKLQKEQDSAVVSNQWNQLFIKNEGWFGGDGIFGIPMDGKEFVLATDSTVTLFTFGDTMIGHHDGDTLLKKDFKMINNSVGILKGRHPINKKINFHWKKDEGGEAIALFKPNTPNSKLNDYYWLGDGFVNAEGDDNLYVFAYPVQEKDTTGIGGFNFEQIGVNLLMIPKGSKPPYLNHKQLETPFFDAETQTSFGSAIFVNTKTAGAPHPDGYIYSYAVSNQNEVKGLLVARVPSEDFITFDKWRFWNGSNWIENMKNATFIAEDVSNEMSVSPLSNGKIILTYQNKTMSPDVVIQIGESLVGPFNDKKFVYQASEFKRHKAYFTYNAKAYPHLSSPNTLLISYNVNSFNFWTDILNHPNLYRPRFIEWKIKE